MDTIKKESGSDVDIKISITDIKVEIKEEDSDYKTASTPNEIMKDDNNYDNNDPTSLVNKQENQFDLSKSNNTESQDMKPIVKYFEYEERMQAKIEQDLLTSDNEAADKHTKKDNRSCLFKKENQSNEQSDSSIDVHENQDIKPTIVKYFVYEEKMQVKMENDLLQEGSELEENLSQSASGESGLVISDVRSLCKEGKLYVI